MDDLSPSYLLSMLLPRLPFLMVWVVGVVFAVVRWERHPVVSALVVGSGAVDVLLSVAYLLIPLWARREGASMGSMGLVYGLMGMVNAVALAVLLFAVFAERDGKRDLPPA